VNTDVKRIFFAQAIRALAYGFGSVLLGVSLDTRGWSSTEVGLVLTSVVGGAAIMSIAVGTVGDRIGRRRFYAGLYLTLAVSGAVYAFADVLWLLILVALAGALSTDVVESGPFTSLEQGMLPGGLSARERTQVFGTYNTIAALAGAAGALLAGGPALIRDAIGAFPADERFFLIFVPIGLVGAFTAASLSGRVEIEQRPRRAIPLNRSRTTVMRLAGLFAVDAFGGAFVIQSFIAYWFHAKFGLSIEALGVVFFTVAILQAASFWVAVRLAHRIGLLNTMVFTHLPSNVLLVAIPLAPSAVVAIALLFGRYALSSMDVPARQAYIANLVDPDERTAAAAYTNTARYTVRPLGPLLAGAGQRVTLGLPFFLGGGIKIVYDIVLWSWFRRVPLEHEAARSPRSAASQSAEGGET
jgi:MFS family permease